MCPRAPRGETNEKMKTRSSPRVAKLQSANPKALTSSPKSSRTPRKVAKAAQKAADTALTPRRRGRPDSNASAKVEGSESTPTVKVRRTKKAANAVDDEGQKDSDVEIKEESDEETTPPELTFANPDKEAATESAKTKKGRKKKGDASFQNRIIDALLDESDEISIHGPPAASELELPVSEEKTDSGLVLLLPQVDMNKCDHCPRFFKTLQGKRTHESRCKSNPRRIVTEKVPDCTVIDLPNTSVDPAKVTINDQFYSSSGNLPFGDDLMDPLSDDLEEGSSPPPIPSRICPCCGDDFDTAHTIGEYQCEICSSLFKEKASLERHIKALHLGTGLDCPQCGVKCPDKGTLARHLYTHTGLKPYSCKVCKQEFSRKYHLVRHNMQTGCDGKAKPEYPCLVCGRSFSRKDNLREHLRVHMGQTKRKKTYICDPCGIEFAEASQLQVHRKTHSGERQYLCDFCPKRFPSSGAMKKHRRTHTGERPYECQTCHKCFAAKETLNRHVRIHTGHKPHACNYCGKRFIQSSQLRSHLFYHTGGSSQTTVLTPTETFSCELCGKKFNRRARLNEHIKFLHLGAKPFECALCPKTFIRKEDLNRHMIIHSGVKAHKCPICGKAFAMKSSLKVHLLTHTKEPPRSCDECGRAFIRQDCLLRHMRNKHRDMLEEIRSEAEKKKLQQQLLQVAAEASLVEGLEDREELDDNGLTEAVRELLTLLVDEATLKGLGWPTTGVEALLEAVIRRCGHEPAPASTPHHDRLRHNVKLLFTVVIDDSAVKALLNNQTVDEVILHVLRLAKS